MAKNRLTFGAKKLFFDTKAVQRKMKSGTRKALSKAGAVVRRKARDILGRKVKNAKANPAGKPPKTRSGEPNLKTIYFIPNDAGDSVIVGPIGFNGKGNPGLHEHGGSAVIKTPVSQFKKRGKVKKPRLKKDKNGNSIHSQKLGPKKPRQLKKRPDGASKLFTSVTINLPKRPFMGPALEAKKREFPALFRKAFK
jgi:hypothetical protein